MYLIVPSSGLSKPPAADMRLAALFNPTWLKSFNKKKQKIKNRASERQTKKNVQIRRPLSLVRLVCFLRCHQS